MVTRKQSPGRIKNRLLASLPQRDYRRLLTKMEEVSLGQGQRLIAPGEAIDDVYFPLDAMISMVSRTEEGTSVETCVVGCEGMMGVPALFGTATTPMESVVQISGGAMRMAGKDLRREFDAGGALQGVLLRYLHVLVVEISQTAACNKLHSIDGRLARWLLMGSDSIGTDELPLTHDFLSQMLGVRRAGVTEAAGRLRARGLVSYQQGRVRIINREGLEDVACECYTVVRREVDRLLPL